MWPLAFAICSLACGVSSNEVGSHVKKLVNEDRRLSNAPASLAKSPKQLSLQQQKRQLSTIEQEAKQYRSQIQSLNDAVFQSEQELDQVKLQIGPLKSFEEREQDRASSLQEAISKHKGSRVEEARLRAAADQGIVLRKEQELGSAKYALTNGSSREAVLQARLKADRTHTAEAAHETKMLTDHLALASEKIHENQKELDRLSSDLFTQINKTGALAKTIQQAKIDNGDTGKKTMSVLQHSMGEDAVESSMLKRKIATTARELQETEARLKEQMEKLRTGSSEATRELQEGKTRMQESAETSEKQIKELLKTTVTMRSKYQKQLQATKAQEASEESNKLQLDRQSIVMQATNNLDSLTKNAQASLIAERNQKSLRSGQHQAATSHLVSELNAVRAAAAKRVGKMTSWVKAVKQEILQVHDQQFGKVAKIEKHMNKYRRHAASLGKVSAQFQTQIQKTDEQVDDAQIRIGKAAQRTRASLQRYQDEVRRVENLYTIMKNGADADWGSEEVKALNKKLRDVHAHKEHSLAPLMAQFTAAQQLAASRRQVAAAVAAESAAVQRKKDSLEQLQADFDVLESERPHLDDKPDPSVQAVLKEFQGSSLIQVGSKSKFLRAQRKHHQ